MFNKDLLISNIELRVYDKFKYNIIKLNLLKLFETLETNCGYCI